MDEGEVHDADNIRKRHPDSGGFSPEGRITKRILAELPADDPSLSPGRDAKPFVDPKIVKNSSGFAVGDPNRVPSHWEGGEILRVEDIKNHINKAIDAHNRAIERLVTAEGILERSSASLAGLIQGSEDEAIMVTCEVGFESVERIHELVATLQKSIEQMQQYMNKL
jgi:hypothetical protein